MSPEAYAQKAAEIRQTRQLQVYQEFDLRLQVHLVRERGHSTTLDDYYLEICGVSPVDYGIAPKRVKPPPAQGSLF